MKYTQVAADAFQKLQLNAGVLLTSFDPSTGTLVKTNIFGATGGGVAFEATPTFIDFGEDIDNVPNNTMELKQLDYFEAKLSGTFKTVDTDLGKKLIAAADVEGAKITPRSVLKETDFVDVWWVGDYSDVTTGDDAGFMAVKLKNALSTGGFKIQSNDKGKGDFAFEFTAHYSLDDIDDVPFEIYVKEGQDTPEADATLSALAIGSLTLTPTFSSSTTSYAASTTNSTNTITATATDANATVVIKNGTTTVTSGESATWTTGENTVTVTVTNGTVEKVYTVIVTKS